MALRRPALILLESSACTLILPLICGCTGHSIDAPQTRPQEVHQGDPRTAQSFELSIHPVDRQINAGDPVKITVVLRNVSRQKASILESRAERDIWLYVTDEHGERVPMTELGKRFENRAQ